MRVVVGAVVLIAVAVASDARAGDSPRAIAAIENDLVADDPAVRAKAAGELMDRFPDGAVTLPMLVDLLDDESGAVVVAAADVIDSMAVYGVTPLSAYLVDDKHWQPSTHLVRTLPYLMRRGPPASVGAFDLARVERGAPMSSSEAVTVALVSMPDGLYAEVLGNESAMPWLLRPLRKATSETCPLIAAAMSMHAADELVAREIPPPPHPRRNSAASGPVILLRSTAEGRAWAGARLVARLREPDKVVVDALAKRLGEWQPATELRAGHPADGTVMAACEAVGRIGPAAAAAAPLLESPAGKESVASEFVDECVRALVRIGKEADVVALFDSRPPTLDDLTHWLARHRLGASHVVPYLVDKVKRSAHSVQDLESLASYGPDATQALPCLRQLAIGATWDDAVRLADTILAISPGDAESLKAVQTAMNHSDQRVKANAANAFMRRAPPGAPLVALLQVELTRGTAKPDRGERDVLHALARCGEVAGPAVPELLKVLASADKACSSIDDLPRASVRRVEIVKTLGRIGPAAEAAVPTLAALRDKGDETIRVPAAQALRRIQAKK